MSLADWPALSADYAEHHRTRGNRVCHFVGIPLIVYAVAAWTRVFGIPIVVVLLPVYFVWDARLGALVSAFVLACALAARVLPPWAAWAAFVGGWVLQFAGHAVWEKRSPAFARNLIHLLVGPAWIAAELTGLRR